MKFTKTAVAVAIAGFVAVPMAASAETTLSGLVQIKVQGNDRDAPDDDPLTEDIDESDVDNGDLNMAAGDVRLAINSQNEIVGGLTGYGNIQFNLDDLTGEGGIEDLAQVGSLEDNDGGVDTAATVAADNIYVGIKGGFGDVRVGEIPLAVEYGQVANDIYDVGDTVVDGFSYVGAFGPVGIIANYALDGDTFGVVDGQDSDMAGIGAKVTFAGVTFGAGYELRNLSGDESGNLAVGLSFALAGFSIGAHYWIREDVNDGEDGIDFQGDDQSASVQIGYGIAGVNLGLTYSLLTSDITDQDEAEDSAIRLDAGYDLGGGMDISTRIQSTDNDPARDGVDSDLVEYRVQLTKNF